MNILIAGFPYVRESYFNTFNHYPAGDELRFLLPSLWKPKSGKVVFRAPTDPRVTSTTTWFYHSHYPFLGGLLKGFMPAFPVRLRVLRTQRPVDLAYICSEPVLLSTLYMTLCCRWLNVPFVLFTWENVDYRQKLEGLPGAVKRLILKTNLRLARGIICGNQKAQRIIEGLTNKPTVLIPMNGLDPDFFKPATRETRFKESDFRGKIVFTFVGAIGYRKGIHLIIDAFKRLVKNNDSVHLVIAGSGEYDDTLSSLIRQAGLTEHCSRFSWISHAELRELLSVSDVFLYPSIAYGGWEEQFGYSMAEASLMELPVVSSRSGSIEEVVIDGETGILTDPGDATQLFEAMRRLATDSNLRQTLGRNGREHIIRNFDHAVIARKFYDFFHKV